MPSTPGTARSAEAPMQYEWEKPRQFPASPFAAAGASKAAAEDLEPPKKRTHYEAMDVDTPPRPSASFPPSATQTADPFHFSDQANAFPAAPAPPHPLAFDAGGFHPKEAFGLADEPAIQEISMTADDGPSEVFEDSADKQGLEVILREDEGESKSRKGSGQAKKRASRRRRPTTDDEGTDASDADESGSGPGFLDILKAKKGRRAGDSQFSFQVHHHHAPQGGISPGVAGVDAATAVQPPPERWLRKSTPYVLLGYVQFGSLALLAILTIGLLLLFLSTLYYDIQARLAELTVELRGEMIQCAKAYVDNFCQDRRIPALERKCNEWEECMNREVVVTGKTRVVAETLAEVVNGFVDVISFKTMLFVILTLGLTIYGSSVALSILPSRTPTAPTASPGLGPPHFAQPNAYGHPAYPYGLPYNAGTTPWVVENGHRGGDGDRARAIAPASSSQGAK
ncbi:hypothetical protein C6P46_000420 [Rhodotorula mucilaginosa]|uniref:Brl1/Brr6 domain-containing protein n=1 Tax=Rhodotorula mucilaginosa TaxID=5537 RepID=A0A9P6VVH9_RHOMI|nr:hypothetical protein C6P46_000420 [Rhodotorula mucilaginosa]